MSWSDFYLLCFLVGFSLSVISFLAGAVHLHLPFNMHFPFHGHVGGVHAGGHSGGHSAAHGGAQSHGGSHISWFNAFTVLAFLTWFGGTGYILTKKSHLIALLSLTIAIVAGSLAASLVFKFMARLMKETGEMFDWDYRHEGAVGTVSMTIRANDTGEVIFEQHGIRRSVGARSEDGLAIEKGTEVVISRYEKGIAYVKKWDEFVDGKV
jgi:membrane protein implicated in regulation of membrane protease activity